jgi:hypothetical protein
LSDLIKSRDVVENILLAKKYRVKEWLRDGYMNLILQTRPVKIGVLLSLNDLLTIARICFIRDTIKVNCRTPNQAYREIDEIFADEMKEMEDLEDISPTIMDEMEDDVYLTLGF